MLWYARQEASSNLDACEAVTFEWCVTSKRAAGGIMGHMPRAQCAHDYAGGRFRLLLSQHYCDQSSGKPSWNTQRAFIQCTGTAVAEEAKMASIWARRVPPLTGPHRFCSSPVNLDSETRENTYCPAEEGALIIDI